MQSILSRTAGRRLLVVAILLICYASPARPQTDEQAEHLAGELLAAPTEAARDALLRASADLATDELVKALLRRGQSLAGEGGFAQAEIAYRLAGEVAQRLEDKPALIAAWRLTGMLHSYLGDNEQALVFVRRSLALAEQVGDKSGVRNALNTLGIIYNQEGDYTQALACHERSLRLSEESGDKVAVARDLNNIASVLYAQANFALALDYLLRSLKLKEEAGNKPGMAYTLNNIAGVYGKQGDYARAMDYLQRSLALKEELKDVAGMADTLHNIGSIYLEQHEYAQALDYEQRSLKLAEAVASSALLCHIWIDIGEIHLNLGAYQAALEAAENAAAIARKADIHNIYWQARAISGKSHLGLNEPGLARRDLLESVATIEALRTRVAGNEQDRQRFFQGKVAPYHALVNLSVAQNEPAEALRYAEQAKGRVLLDVLGNGRDEINKAMTPAEISRDHALTTALTALNNQLARRKLQPKDNETELTALEAQVEKARLEYESFQTDLYAAHPDLRVQRGQTQPLSLKEAAELLQDGRTALLEYVLTDEKCYLLVLTKAPTAAAPHALPVRLTIYPLKLTSKELARAAEEFQAQMERRDLTVKETARGLYDVLVRPAEEQLRGVKTLCIVPDAALWAVPFQALHTGAQGYLIEQYAVFYAPSLSVLREMRRKSAAIRGARGAARIVPVSAGAMRVSAPASPRSRLFAIGNPALSKAGSNTAQPSVRDEPFSPLPDAEREVGTLRALYGADRSRVLTGAQARERTVKLEAGKYSVLHFAAHAVLDDNNPMYSRIMLARSEGDAQEDGLLEAWELTKLELSAELVVLSACQTARGRFSAGEGIIGMTWALFIAGSPAAVVSQWRVDSARSADLMIDFHRQLMSTRGGPAQTKAEALRQAALHMLRGPYNHPSYWAGFILIGDAQ